MKTLLWLDDIRDPSGYHTDGNTWASWFSPIREPYNIIWIKNYTEFTDWITKNGLPDGICFDHDLDPNKGLPDLEIVNEKTGQDCAKWLIDYCLDKSLDLPRWNCQSANPVGKENINCLLNSFIKHNQND